MWTSTSGGEGKAEAVHTMLFFFFLWSTIIAHLYFRDSWLSGKGKWPWGHFYWFLPFLFLENLETIQRERTPHLTEKGTTGTKQTWIHSLFYLQSQGFETTHVLSVWWFNPSSSRQNNIYCCTKYDSTTFQLLLSVIRHKINVRDAACIRMFPKTRISTGRLLSALCLFSVNAVLPLEAPPVPGWLVLSCQILVGGFRSRRAGSCGCEIVRRALLSQVRVAAGVLLDGGHPQPPCAVRGGAAARTGGRGTAAGCGSGPDLAQLLRLRGLGGGRGPAGGGGGRLRRLDDAHGRWLEVVQHFLTLKSKERHMRLKHIKADRLWLRWDPFPFYSILHKLHQIFLFSKLNIYQVLSKPYSCFRYILRAI